MKIRYEKRINYFKFFYWEIACGNKLRQREVLLVCGSWEQKYRNPYMTYYFYDVL